MAPDPQLIPIIGARKHKLCSFSLAGYFTNNHSGWLTSGGHLRTHFSGSFLRLKADVNLKPSSD